MRLISISFFCLVTIVGVQAVDPGRSECTSESCSTKEGALEKADKLLASMEADANNLEKNFVGASKLLRRFELTKHEDDGNVIAILRAFLNLKRISASFYNFKPQCTSEEFDILIQMRRLMDEHSTEENSGGSRIQGFFNNIRRRYFHICSERVKHGVVFYIYIEEYLKKLEYFSIFLEKESRNEGLQFIRIDSESYVDQLGVAAKWKRLLLLLGSTRDLFIFDSSTGKYDLNESYATELLSNLFKETCDRIDSSADVREIFELGSKMLDEYYKDESLDPVFTFEPFIGNYVICKAAKEYDYLELLKRHLEEFQDQLG